MSEKEAEGNPASDSKFQRFAASIERALKGFEVTKEWHDLISCLAKLHKVLLAYTHFRIIPHKHLICKRLSQCLHPNLPGGVHLKVLEVFKALFDRIGRDGLSRDLFIYSSGLFPLFDYASMQVRPSLLDLYETYLLPLGPGLLPGLQGFIVAVLPGLEEGSECIQRVTILLDDTAAISPSAFAISIWNTLYRSPSLRQPAAEYMLGHLNKGKSEVCQTLKRIDECQDVMVSSLCATLHDTSTIVVRHALDLTSHLLPLNSSTLPSSCLTHVVTAVLHTLTRRDNSLTRRVYSWLLGNMVQNSSLGIPQDTTESSEVAEDGASMYFTSFVRPRLITAIKSILFKRSLDSKDFGKAHSLNSHRILKALTEKSELHEMLLELLPDYLLHLKYQLGFLGNCPFHTEPNQARKRRDRGKPASLSDEICHTANQFLAGLNRDMLWKWMREFIEDDLKGMSLEGKADERDIGRMESVLTVLKLLPQQNSEPIVSSYLPLLIQHYLEAINLSLTSISLSTALSYFSFVGTLLNLVRQILQSLNTGKASATLSFSSLHCEEPMLPDTISHSSSDSQAHGSSTNTLFTSARKKLTLPPPSTDGDGTCLEVYTSLQKHLVTMLCLTRHLLNRFIMTHVAKLGDSVPSQDHLAEVMKKLHSDPRCNVGERLSCGSGDRLVEEAIGVLCDAVVHIVEVLVAMDFICEYSKETDSLEPPSPWVYGLMLSCLHTNNAHVFLSSLNTIVSVWKCERECTGTNIKNIIGPFGFELKGKKDFIKFASSSLWHSLSQVSLTAHHSHASSLLYDLHQLSLPGTLVEDVILEEFANSSVVPYQNFLVFWKCLLSCKDTSNFKRLLLRVLEGLQSKSPSIQNCATTWVRSLSESRQLSCVIQPLYNLIIDATPPKRLPQYESPRTPKPFLSHAQYYFGSVEIEEDKIEEEIPPYPLYYFSQTVDAPRLQYGLSLFLSFLIIDPIAICTHLAAAYMTMSSGFSSPIASSFDDQSDHMVLPKSATFSNGTEQFFDPAESPVQGKDKRPRRLHSSVAKSLLELILTYCSNILLTDYSTKLEVSHTEISSLTSIKITAVTLTVNILKCMTGVVSGDSKLPEGQKTSLTNATYILCLLALCDMQKSTLVALLQMVDIYKNIPDEDAKRCDNEQDNTVRSNGLVISLPHLQPLFLQLLKALYYEICLESLAANVAKSPMSLKKTAKKNTNSDDKMVSYVPGSSLVTQPLFFHIINSILSRSHLVLQQTYVLSIFCHSLWHFRDSLEHIAPKILKQVYRNLKELLTEKNSHIVNTSLSVMSRNDLQARRRSSESSSPWRGSNGIPCQTSELVAVYLNTISNIVHFCLLLNCNREASAKSNTTRASVPPLHYQIVDPFWNLTGPHQSEYESSTRLTTSSAVTPEKSSFNLGWLFGGVFNGGVVNEQDKKVEEKQQECRGVSSPAGQKVLWQLQHVYGALVKVWAESSSDNGKMDHLLKKDLDALVKQFLEPMITYDHILFYTTVAQTWMHWSLVGKSKQQLKELFIQMLHTYKLQSLEAMVSSVSETLESLRETTEEVSKERQKYLLNFLLCYLSSPLQSTEELTSSFSTVISFLKDTHYDFTAVMSSGSHSTTSSLVCTLTSILHVFVGRVPIPDVQTNKKQRKDLQDIIFKLCESLSLIVESIVSSKLQTHSNHIALQQQQQAATARETTKKDENGAKKAPKDASPVFGELEVQAISTLSVVLPRFIDSVYSDEKDRVSYLLKVVLKCVWPILKLYSPPTKAGYVHASKLVSSLSDFQVTRKFWKDDILELFLEQTFFVMDKNSIQSWKTTIDNLMSQDKAVFTNLISRIPVSSVSPAAGMVSMFLSVDQERKHRAKMLKRLAFVILCGEHDQYNGQIHEISEKLLDSIRCFPCPSVSTQVLLTLRVLLVKVSADGLVSLWPSLVSELFNDLSVVYQFPQTFALNELKSDLGLELATPQPVNKEKLVWYWSACRVLETLVSLPDQMVPHWQLVSWGYLGAVFGESLERDIAETSILQDQLGKKRTEETEIRGIADGGKSQDVHTKSKQKNGERSHSVERWSLIDEVLQEFKDHSQDNKQLKLSTIPQLPALSDLKTVTQLVGFLQYLSNREVTRSMVPPSGLKSDEAMAVDEIIRQVFLDFID